MLHDRSAEGYVQRLEERIEELEGSVERRREPVLSDEERAWVKLAIKREAQSFELRRAIIEKTLAGLVWAGIVALGYIMLEYLQARYGRAP